MTGDKPEADMTHPPHLRTAHSRTLEHARQNSRHPHDTDRLPGHIPSTCPALSQMTFFCNNEIKYFEADISIGAQF